MIIGRHNGDLYLIGTRCPSIIISVKQHDLLSAFTRKGGYYIYMSEHKLKDLCHTLPPEHMFRKDPPTINTGLCWMVGVEFAENGDINAIWLDDTNKKKPFYFRNRVSHIDWERDNFVIDREVSTYGIYQMHDLDTATVDEVIQIIRSEHLHRLDGVSNKIFSQTVDNSFMQSALSDYYKDGKVPDCINFNKVVHSTDRVIELKLDTLLPLTFENFQHGTPPN